MGLGDNVKTSLVNSSLDDGYCTAGNDTATLC